MQTERVRPAVLADWKFLGIVMLVAVLVSGAPYLYGWLTTPRDLVFMGVVQNGPDSGEYLAWMRESMRGVFISNTLTPEPNAAVFFNLVFWLFGRLALYTGMTMAQVYQVFRIISGGLFLVSAYHFCARLVSDLTQRRIAFLLLVFGSGFSLHITLIEKIIGEIKFPAQFTAEGTTLYSLMSFPLLMLGAAMFTFIFALALDAYQQKRLRPAVYAGVVALILGWSHGYDLILIYAVLGVFTLVVLLRDGMNWHWFKSVALIGALSVWGPVYMVLLTRTNATWREALGQFVNAGVFTPDPLQLVWLLGLPFLLAIVTFDGILPLRERDPRELFVKVWFGVTVLLIYLPVEYQIHFLNGWQIPIALLATGGLYRHALPVLARLDWLRRWSTTRAQLALALAFVVFVAPTSFYFIGQRVLDLSRHQLPYFLTRDQMDALDWLNQNASPDSIVLSSYEVGHWIPGMTGTRAYLAHWAMTLRFFDKRAKVEQFFDPTTTDLVRRDTLDQFGVRYVLWSDAERALGAWNPDRAIFLEPVWVSPRAVIYRVKIATAWRSGE
ncbi:MAG: hypothetical protein HY868_09695 [Chloroflexi bacterium]|nr:hypothetical protein [Chloroflexota bacterium]